MATLRTFAQLSTCLSLALLSELLPQAARKTADNATTAPTLANLANFMNSIYYARAVTKLHPTLITFDLNNI